MWEIEYLRPKLPNCVVSAVKYRNQFKIFIGRKFPKQKPPLPPKPFPPFKKHANVYYCNVTSEERHPYKIRT